jgi:hypothetical protein
MFPRFAISILLVLGLAAPVLGASLDPPNVSVVSSDRTSITLQVQAGPSGAPAGFVVEWLPADRYRALAGWPASCVSGSDFTGVPTLNVMAGAGSYQLGANEATTVVLGELFDETGLEARDPQELEEGTEYVVRVRAAAAGSGLEESANSATIDCVTPHRKPDDCTESAGYWTKHPESWSRVTRLELGSVTYTTAQILAILRQPARGNGLVALAHQLIATRFNLMLGVVPSTPVKLAADRADALIGSLVVPPVGGNRLSPCSTRGLTWILRGFNNGTTGPGRCPRDHQVLSTTPTTWGSLKAIYR